MAKHGKKSTDVALDERTPATRNRTFGSIGLDEWFDRWPEMFARRWPEALRGFPLLEDSFRVEETLEDDGTFVLRAELPGIDPDKDVDVTVENGHLRIKAEREDRSEQTENGRRRSEFRYGSFERSIRLPEGADDDAITATFDSGILEVRVPNSGEPPAAKSIPVKSGG